MSSVLAFCLPTYFRQVGVDDLRFLKRALDSIVSQEFPGPHEVLVIDDGSETPVEEVTRAFASTARYRELDLFVCGGTADLLRH